ncbi:MAG: MBL fold metallo-hydrolase [Desulfobulbaceae bacterium]|uniref:L-ascorbate metabolism protein UlaG, beta-lactamase superfamily n=1 Tax=Desulfofustis glycolicus DSM 9705 TaxID=1121409 RepID=A0A1M5Y0S8_9BACT|nr:MBL fold metallo-hydrolase [Desulfobulbaceae bacterium]SHI05660.1 L-ascorbate metabolism protein UlaG, beta-lactamase superfamily [Desulfofustis glycolicus DSM 9705]
MILLSKPESPVFPGRCFLSLRFLSFVLPLVLCASCLFTPPPFSERQWQQEVARQDPADLYAAHQQEGRFFNPWMPEERRGLLSVLRWRLTRAGTYTPPEESYLPRLIPDLAQRLAQLPAGRDILVWIGHGTFLLRLDGSWWLTDPMLSQRALLPKRLTEPALRKEDVAVLDGPLNVIISHNHYDHLDSDTIERLPEHARFFVPLGIRKLIESLHGGEVVELDWWQRRGVDGAELVCLPAQHWSLRLGVGRNTSLWASFLIRSGKTVVYFGGDSGYFVGYREFGRVFADIDYALLPTTAYHPRWFMHYPHLNGEEAVQAFADLGARVFVPTQWGTFRLGDEPAGYPRLDLDRIIAARGLPEERYLRPELGEIVFLDSGP